MISGGGGGWLSDRAVKHHADTGRLKLAIACLMIQMGALLCFFAGDSRLLIAGYTVFVICATYGTILSYMIMPELVPAAGRGRILALHQFTAIMLGLGLGPTLVGILADRVFIGDAMLRYAILGMAMPLILLSGLMLVLALPRVRALGQIMRQADQPV